MPASAHENPRIVLTPAGAVALAWAGSLAGGEDLARLGIGDRTRFESAVPAARARLLTGRALLRRAAAFLTGGSEDGVSVGATCAVCGGPHGRPAVTVAGSRLAASVAHAAGGTVVAVSTARRVGVDVEAADAQITDALSVLGDPARREVLDWTRVEAVLKADGRGLLADPARVRIDQASRRGRVADRDEWYHLVDVLDVDGLVVSVAVL